MPITVTEPGNYEAYSILVDAFQARLTNQGTQEALARADMCNERERGNASARRFIATNDNGMVVGWMTLKIQDDDVKIEGICVDPIKANSSGASKALITRAVNYSFALGKRGAVSLTNISHGTGDALYLYMGFRYVDATKMRLELDYRKWDVRETGESVETKRGTLLPVVEHFRRDDVS